MNGSGIVKVWTASVSILSTKRMVIFGKFQSICVFQLITRTKVHGKIIEVVAGTAILYVSRATTGSAV